jgi:hypothetical protein
MRCTHSDAPWAPEGIPHRVSRTFRRLALSLRSCPKRWCKNSIPRRCPYCENAFLGRRICAAATPVSPRSTPSWENIEQARAEAAEVLRIEPKWTIGTQATRMSPFKRTQDAEHYFDGLRKAGLPEK